MTLPLYIIDCGLSDPSGVRNAFAQIGVVAENGSRPTELCEAAGLVLAGDGAFGPAMADLEERGLVDFIRDQVQQGVPLLGIGLGMQLLFESSEEDLGTRGLGLLAGNVRLLPPGLEIPHMGWNRIEIAKYSELLQDVPDGSSFYFVHSYVAVPRRPQHVLTLSECGVGFVSGVEWDNVTGFQFHLERSGMAGLQICRNFVRSVGLKGEWKL